MKNHSIIVIIPNYNGLNHLPECLTTLNNQTYKNFKIIIADDFSIDDSVKYVSENFPDIKIIISDKRKGFAANINKGIREGLKTDAKYFLLLNNDVVCNEKFLENWIMNFDESKYGFSACKMINYYNRDTLDDCGIMFNEYGHPFARGNGEEDLDQYNNDGKIIGCCAGAGLYKREIFENELLFDESFIAYYEDVDLALRINLNGYKCAYIPEAVCWHKRGATYGKRKYYDTKMCARNLLLIIFKNYSWNFIKRKFLKMIEGEIRRYFHLAKNLYIKELFYTMIGQWSGIIAIIKNYKSREKVRLLAANNNALDNLF